MGNEFNQNEKESWIGKRGFDEAKYYWDEIHEISSGPEDDEIAARVREAISRNWKLCAVNLTVEVCEGLVTLKGQVPSAEEKKEASDIAQSLSGVKAVRNQLDY